MLMEGYDHQYLSVLAIFRPYRSINAFAQVVGRVLRAIPENEIAAFEIDNNAVVVYHEETGLDTMWGIFQKEVDRAKHQRVREYPAMSDSEYVKRDMSLAGVSSGRSFVSDQDSYLADVDFNELFAIERAGISSKANAKIEQLRVLEEFDDDDLEDLKAKFIARETRKAAKDIDPNLIAKRPDQARRKMREILTKKAQDEVASLLSDLNIDGKDTKLASRFMRFIPGLQAKSPNDGTLVRYVNAKLYNKFGPVKDRNNKTLLRSIEMIPIIIGELRKMLP